MKKIIYKSILVIIFISIFAIRYEAHATTILASGTSGDLEWSVDDEGCFRLNGDGDYEIYDSELPYWYEYLDVIKSADVNVKNITSLQNLFSGCTNLKYVNWNEIDTSKVTDMSKMFTNCKNLESIDLSIFDTSNVTSMSMMFCNCKNIKKLDVSMFNTSNVTNLNYMFNGCESLSVLDVSNFNTANVESMSGMFQDCYNLKTINLSNFDTSQVKYMDRMFEMSAHLLDFEEVTAKMTNLDLSNFDTLQVKDMSRMFFGCGKLSDLNISSFDTRQVTDMGYMFAWCSNLNLDVIHFDTSNVLDMGGFFAGCDLKTVDLNCFDTSKVTNMDGMFRGCDLTGIDFTPLNTSSVTHMGWMFMRCTGERLDLTSFDTTNVTNITEMFYDCPDLKYLDISSFDLSSLEAAKDMLYGTYNLTFIKVPLHLKLNIELEEDNGGAVWEWENERGEICNYLPKNLSQSYLLKRKGAKEDIITEDTEKTDIKYATSTTSRYTEQVKKVLSDEKFKTYSATLRNISCVIPGLEQTNMVNSGCDNMVPQGVCVAGDLLLISAYCHSHSNETTGTTWYEGKEFQGWCHRSVLYVMDKRTQSYITTIVLGDLPAGCHVGGLAYDGDYDMVAIADSESKQKKIWFMDCGTVRAAVESGRDSGIVTGLSSANVNNTPSFLLYFGHRYYVGTFNKGEDTNTKMNEYVLEYAPGTANPYTLRPTGRKTNLPPQCQGVAVTADNDMFCSCSYGRGNASKMYVYKLKRTESVGLVSTAKATDQFRYGVTFPNMTEDMDIYGDTLLTCYESAANNYQQFFSRCKYPMDRITMSSAYGLLKNQSQIRTFSSRAAEDDAALSLNGGMNVAAEGECGANLQYTLYTDGSMSVTGQGDMEDYTESAAPWTGMQAEVIKLVIGAGVDSIGAGAFADCENLQSVEVSALSDEDRTFTIGSRAFAGCTALQTVTLPDKTFDIAEDAFSAGISVELQSDADSVAQYCGNYETLTSHKHDYSFTETVPADCLSAGYDVYTCSCGAEECRDLIESTGEHQYEEISRTDATCTEQGTILYECRICGVYCSEELELTDHVWAKGDVTAATEQTQGYTIYTCSMCGETEQRDYVASGGENSENVGKTEAGIGQVDNPISDTEPIAIGTKLTSGTADYIVTEADEKGGMVAYTASKKAKKTVVIPDTVVYNGVTYKVTSIKVNAFKNNKKLQSVTIGKNIKKIGKNAFYGCKNLKKITIKSTVLKSVGKNAIKNIHKKAVIKCPKKQLKKYKKLLKKSTGYKNSMKIKK